MQNFGEKWRYVKKKGEAKDIGGGCAHLIGRRGGTVDVSHCEVFAPKQSDVNEYIKHLMNKRHITKCKSN